jgi:serine/threonine protein phosphatase 1
MFSAIVAPGDVIAVGDIHGRLDLLTLFLDHVKGTGARVILLGDLIDRGDDCVGVLNRAKQLLDDPEAWGLESFTVLRGNHEQMMIDAFTGPFSSVVLWSENGGRIDKAYELAPNVEWLEKLPIYTVVGDTLFTHAGLFPGHDPAKSIAEGRTESLIWMRDPFLTVGPVLGAWTDKIKRVVHGHTPYLDDRLGQINVSASGDRICIDSGAVYSGILATYNATAQTFWQHTIAQ